MARLELDSDKVAEMCKTAEGVALTPDAEQALLQLLDVQERINNFVEIVKAKIVENAMQFGDDFVALKTDNLKLEYRAFGSEFELEDHATVDTTFVTLTERMTVNVKAVKDFMAEHEGQLPTGIVRRERTKTLVIKRK